MIIDLRASVSDPSGLWSRSELVSDGGVFDASGVLIDARGTAVAWRPAFVSQQAALLKVARRRADGTWEHELVGSETPDRSSTGGNDVMATVSSASDGMLFAFSRFPRFNRVGFGILGPSESAFAIAPVVDAGDRAQAYFLSSGVVDARDPALAWVEFDGRAFPTNPQTCCTSSVHLIARDTTPPTLAHVALPSTGAIGGAIRASADARDRWQSVRLMWDFGDGTPPTSGSNVSHTYARAGRFLVRIVASDQAANTTIEEHSISISIAHGLVRAALRFSRSPRLLLPSRADLPREGTIDRTGRHGAAWERRVSLVAPQLAAVMRVNRFASDARASKSMAAGCRFPACRRSRRLLGLFADDVGVLRTRSAVSRRVCASVVARRANVVWSAVGCGKGMRFAAVRDDLVRLARVVARRLDSRLAAAPAGRRRMTRK